MDKRGAEDLQSFVIYIIFVILIFTILLFFINNSSMGSLSKEQILAKQIALFLDAAKPGTEIMINKGNFTIEISGNKVKVKSNPASFGYTYDFFTKHYVNTEDKVKDFVIKVS